MRRFADGASASGVGCTRTCPTFVVFGSPPSGSTPAAYHVAHNREMTVGVAEAISPCGVANLQQGTLRRCPARGLPGGAKSLSPSLYHAATFGRPARQVDDASDGGAGLNVNAWSALALWSVSASIFGQPLCGPGLIPCIWVGATPLQ